MYSYYQEQVLNEITLILQFSYHEYFDCVWSSAGAAVD